MAKTVEISMESLQRLLQQIQEYFMGITLFQQIAWGAVGLGSVLVVFAAILW